MATWQDLTGLIGAALGLPYTLFEKLRDRDRANASKPFQVYFTDNGNSSTYPTFGSIGITVRLAVPDDATKCSITLQGRVASGSGYLRGKLAGTSTLTSAEVSGITNTSYGNPDQNEYTLTWADVSALRGQTVSLTVESANSTGAGTRAQSIDRASAEWSYD